MEWISVCDVVNCKKLLYFIFTRISRISKHQEVYTLPCDMESPNYRAFTLASLNFKHALLTKHQINAISEIYAIAHLPWQDSARANIVLIYHLRLTTVIPTFLIHASPVLCRGWLLAPSPNSKFDTWLRNGSHKASEQPKQYTSNRRADLWGGLLRLESKPRRVNGSYNEVRARRQWIPQTLGGHNRPTASTSCRRQWSGLTGSDSRNSARKTLSAPRQWAIRGYQQQQNYTHSRASSQIGSKD